MTTAEVHEGATLQEFMGARRREIAAGMTGVALERAAGKDSAALETWVAHAGEGTRAELAARVVRLLQGSVGEIFAGVWSRCAELRKSAAETKGRHDVTELVALADHAFTYSVEPEVEVVVEGVALGSFKFDVELTCRVKGLELQVRDGGIGGVRCGECEGSATILLAGTELWQKRLVHADLPGTLKWRRVWEIA